MLSAKIGDVFTTYHTWLFLQNTAKLSWEQRSGTGIVSTRLVVITGRNLRCVPFFHLALSREYTSVLPMALCISLLFTTPPMYALSIALVAVAAQ